MNYMFEAGFLGTKAPFFMDAITLIVALLPLLVISAISFAIHGKYKLHKTAQLIIFFVSLLVILYFEYGVRIGGGFEKFAQNSTLPYWFLLSFLIIHIMIALFTLVSWIRVLALGYDNNEHFHLSSFQPTKHAKMGKNLTKWIILTSITGVMVYLFLFIF